MVCKPESAHVWSDHFKTIGVVPVKAASNQSDKTFIEYLADAMRVTKP